MSATAIRATAPRAPRMREGVLVAACLQYLTLRGCFVYRQNSGSVTAQHKGKTRFFRFVGVKGASDIVGMTPTGRYIAVECKIKPNKTTREQEWFLAMVGGHGGISRVIYSLDELIAVCKQEGI